MQRAVVFTLFFLSGATALVYEVSWVRELSLIFGATHEATSIVLASFMAGLGLGSLCLGRAGTVARRPLRAYGVLEIGIGAVALFLPLLLNLVNQVYVGAALRAEGVSPGIVALRAALAFGTLSVPTFLMGGTLPVLTRWFVTRPEELTRGLSSLYALNTLGAVAGTVAAGFLLLPRLGVAATQIAAAAGSIAIGVAALLADARMAGAGLPPPDPAGAAAPGQAATAGLLSGRERGTLRLVFWSTAISGACSLALEVLWFRSLNIVTGLTTYSLAIMLASFLFGIGLGSLLLRLLPSARLALAALIGAVLVAAGAASAVVSRLIPLLPEYAVRLNLFFSAGEAGVSTRTTLALSFLVMLAPCALMGVAFPLAGRARAVLRGSAPEAVGDLVFVNTVAGIAGSLVAGFALIPLVGLQRGMLLPAALYLCYGSVLTAAAVRADPRRPGWLGPGIALAGVAVAVMVAALPASRDAELLGKFQNNRTLDYVDPRGFAAVREQLAGQRLLFRRDGRAASVSVVEQTEEGSRRPRLSLLINGKAVATDSVFDFPVETLLGHLPMLLHPDPRSALIVGLGTGTTLGAVTAHPGLARATLVEIEPAVVAAAPLFSRINRNALRDPRVRVVVQDGRNFLLTTRERFDVITADPIHPWTYGSSYLFTQEYFALAREHLAPGGVMCQWLPLYELGPESLRSVAAAFAASFPHATAWHTFTDLMLIGSDAPLAADLGALGARMRQPDVAAGLSAVALEDPLALLAEHALDDAGLRRFAAGAVVNTDDNLFLEFASLRSLGRDTLPGNIRLVNASRVGPAGVVRAGPEAAPHELAALLRAYSRAKTLTVDANVTWDFFLSGGGTDLGALPRAEALLEEALAAAPRYAPARQLVAKVKTAAADGHRRAGSDDRAARALVEALAWDPDNAEANLMLGASLAARGEGRAAARHLRRALAVDPNRPETLLRLAWLLATNPDPGVREPSEAYGLAARALELDAVAPARPLDAMAAAAAAAGRFGEAASLAQRAAALAAQQGASAYAGRIRERAELYRRGVPYLATADAGGR